MKNFTSFAALERSNLRPLTNPNKYRQCECFFFNFLVSFQLFRPKLNCMHNANKNRMLGRDYVQHKCINVFFTIYVICP